MFISNSEKEEHWKEKVGKCIRNSILSPVILFTKSIQVALETLGKPHLVLFEHQTSI